MKLDIAPNERVFVSGMTGSGKSFFTEAFTASFEYVVKLDTKGEFDERRAAGQSVWKGLEEGRDFTVVEHLQDLPNVTTPKIIYAPTFLEQTKETYNTFFQWIYERGNTTLWIDELMSIAENAVTSIPYLRAIYTRGRSKGVGCWACSQRPMDVPTISLANSEHFITFDLMLNQDRKKVVDITGVPQLYERPPEKYQFWYYKVGEEKPLLCRLKN